MEIEADIIVDFLNGSLKGGGISLFSRKFYCFYLKKKKKNRQKLRNISKTLP